MSTAQDSCASWPERAGAGGRVLGRGFQLAASLVPLGLGAKSLLGKAALADGVLVEAADEDLLFGPGFTADEMESLRVAADRSGTDFTGVTFWRGEGAPPSVHASSWPGHPDVAVYDSFFQAPVSEQALTLREEGKHILQAIDAFSEEAIRAAEAEAQRFAKGGW